VIRLVLILVLALAPATEGADPMKLTLGTATPGGGFPVYGDALIAALREVDPDLTLEARNTKGSTENVPLLEKNEVDLALVQGEVAYEALHGIGRPASPIRVVAAMYSTPGMFVVRAGSPARAIEDLRGKPVAFGARGSGLVLLARYVLDGLGLDMERDFQAVYLERAGDGPAMVQDGRVAALWGGGVGWPGFTTVAKAPGGARFLVPDAAGLRRIMGKHTFLKPLTVPAGSYPGQDAPIASLGSWSFIMARPGLSDDAAYRVAKSLRAAEAGIAQRLPQGKETTAANTAAAVARPDLIQPGVRRYLTEAGLLTR
jgi:TRAP transporter TAXI family solute receptor